uniref:Uncharacterized protein n=1 Tax=Panagrolaimus sp. ES5 TaxID=591445 RepID=A0AC34G6L1_9BILA
MPKRTRNSRKIETAQAKRWSSVATATTEDNEQHQQEQQPLQLQHLAKPVAVGKKSVEAKKKERERKLALSSRLTEGRKKLREELKAKKQAEDAAVSPEKDEDRSENELLKENDTQANNVVTEMNEGRDSEAELEELKKENARLLECQRQLTNERKALKKRIKRKQENEARTKRNLEKRQKRAEAKAQQANTST